MLEEFEEFRDLLKQLIEVNGLHMQAVESLSCEQVMNYLIMLLPIAAPTKQKLMQELVLTARWTGLRQAVAELVRKQNPASH
jgi:hypothetical protein